MEGQKLMKLVSVMTVLAIVVSLIGVPVSATTRGSTPAPSCLSSISTSCNITAEDNTSEQTAQLDDCCTALSYARNNETKCFCLLKPYLDDTPSDIAAVAELFTYCSIDGSFDTICPSDGSTSPSDDGTTPSGDTSTTTPSEGDSPSGGVSSTPSSGSSTGNGLGLGNSLEGGVLGQGKAKNAGNKMVTTSISGLLVSLISLVIVGGI